MGAVIRKGRRGRRSNASLFVVFCMLFSMIFTVGAPAAMAKSTRAAIVVEVNGDVSVRKAGGSKSYTAYEDMSLNQGDYIVTGASSSVVLRTADQDDEITVGEHSEVSLSELANQGGGKTSKFKMWAGSAWMKVKSLVSSEDDFEIETPTAVMGVRGTSLFTMVNKDTGTTTMLVTAGIVRVQSNVAAGNGGTQGSHTTLYPSQQINLDSRTQTPDLRAAVNYANVDQIVNLASPRVLESILRGTQEIQKENDDIKKKLSEGLQNSDSKPGDNGILKIQSVDDLNKISGNFDKLIALIAKEAIDAKKIDQKLLDQVNQAISDPLKKIDLTKVEGLDMTAGVDPEVEKLKQTLQQQQQQSIAAKENAELARLMQSILSLLAKIKEQKAAMDAANKKALQEANEQAISSFIATLSAEQLKQFQANQSKNESGTGSQPATPPAAGGGGGGGSSSGSRNERPAAPALISPSTATTSFNPAAVTLRAPADTTIQVFHGSELIGSAPGNGGQDVRIPLKLLSEGSYDLTAQTLRMGRTSDAIPIPSITISDAPILISPASELVTNSPVIVVKAPLNTDVVVLNGGTQIAKAAGKGAQEEVTIPLPQLGTDGVAVYDKLTVVTERTGWRSKEVSIPKITVDRSMGIQLKSATRQNDTVNVQLTMKNFVDAKSIYAAEVHLGYDNRLSYMGDGTVARNKDAVFGSQPESVEVLKQSAASTGTELVYAATNFAANGSAGAISVRGEQPLVTIPLTFTGSDWNQMKMKLFYYKVVDKNGNVIAELKLTDNPIEIPVQ
ncbi:FecR domain-containing protein [Paenibacillus sp. NPDC056579]|uniref:FecR family protein n=1 Tax=Paenibacillus sp. NPDC056579 TaxID=3345871 RepID=UPI0036CA2B17